jgi:hypothetical protein
MYIPFIWHTGFFAGLARWSLLMDAFAAQTTTSKTES